MKGFAKGLAALALGVALVFGVTACGGASDPQMAFIPFGPLDGTQSTAPTQTDESQSNAEYNLIIEEGIANGTVFAVRAGKKSASKAVSGETVTVVMIANAGYELDTISVVAANGYSPQLSYLNVYAKTFVMPKQNVRVRAAFKALPAGKYSITPPTNVDGGSVTSSAASSVPGETVTLGATPDEGMRLDSWEVKDSAGNDIPVTGNTFVMPEGNVTITPIFVKIEYSITVEASVNGSVTASPTTATVGTVVTLTASPANGCELSTLTVTAEGGASVAVSGTGDSRTFTMPAKNVTVTAAFAVTSSAVSDICKKIDTQTINGVKYDIVTFGSWPQTIKAAGVDVSDQCESKIVGDFTYYKGSDGEWYAKIKERGCESHYKYSDGTTIGQNGKNEKWFKVEPIKWRVLTTNFDHDNDSYTQGKKFLLAESILLGRRYNASKNNYQNSEIRKWLNSNADSAAASDHSGSGSFLKTAFTDAEQSVIVETSVDNSARSTNPDADAKKFNNGGNIYASTTPTTDKVFLLSKQEVTTSVYGFADCDAHGTGNKRIRIPTDYAKASGALSIAGDGWSGKWWLRSPYYFYDDIAYNVDSNGYALANYDGVSGNYIGVVPALCLEN